MCLNIYFVPKPCSLSLFPSFIVHKPPKKSARTDPKFSRYVKPAKQYSFSANVHMTKFKFNIYWFCWMTIYAHHHLFNLQKKRKFVVVVYRSEPTWDPLKPSSPS